jgi:limonene-1,2-epoxide hydrolase
MSKLRPIFLALCVVLLANACRPAGPRLVTRPVEVVQAYTAAINDQNVEAALAYVAEEAVYDYPLGEYRGRDQVRTLFQELVAHQWHVDVEGAEVRGDTVYWTARITMCDPQQPDRPSFEIVNQCQSVIQDGKIVLEQSSRAR